MFVIFVPSPVGIDGNFTGTQGAWSLYLSLFLEASMLADTV